MANDDNNKIMEPTFHFVRKRVLLGEDELGDKVLVSELVDGGQILASFPNFEKFKEKGYIKGAIHPGSNTEYDEAKNLIATVAGYPRIDLMKLPKEKETTAIVSVTPLVDISQDRLQATFVIHPVVPGDAKSLLNKNVLEILEREGVIYGVDETACEEAQQFIDAGCPDFKEIVVANGEAAGVGTDAYLEFHLEIGPIAGLVLDDGSIDFRERKIMVGVHSGQHIATKHPPLLGEPGKNVKGELVDAEGGEDLHVKVSHDALFDDESGRVSAGKSGVLSVIKNETIKVCSSQIIEGDVDYETGHIDSMNCVTIRGDVQPGFKVTTGADLEIGGGVMSAIIHSQANAVIKGGITGKKSVITALGDVDLKFIEQGKLQCGGNVVVRKQSYYSDVVSFGDVRFREDSKLVGGKVVAAGSVTLGDVGSENCEPATLAAGVDNERLEAYSALKLELIEQQDAIIQWLQRYGGSPNSKKIRGMEKEVTETKLKLLQLNLVPGTGKYSRGGGDDPVEGSNLDDYSDQRGVAMDKIHIDILGTVYAGTNIRLGNRELALDKNLSKRRFKLSGNQKRILATPITGKRKR